MKTYTILCLIFVCVCSKCESVLLYKTSDNKTPWVLVLDKDGVTYKVDRQVFLADKISLSATNWGTEVTFSNAICYKTVIDTNGSDGPVRQSIVAAQQMKIGFPLGTKLIFHNKIMDMHSVEERDL